jgi:transcriptional regulator GlxA family with amidase domain
MKTQLKRSTLNTIANWADEIFASHFSVKEIAKRHGVTSRQVRRYYRHKTGESLHAFIYRQCLDLAMSKLKSTGGLRIKELAAELGYQVASSLSHAFKKRFGIPPSEARGAA